MADIPEKYEDLPDKKRYWPFPPSSHEEGLGMLRLLTPEIVADAARTQIQNGERVCLNWDLEKLDFPGTWIIYFFWIMAKAVLALVSYVS